MILIVLYLYLIVFRSKHPEPKYLPTAFLKSKWRAWRSTGTYGRIAKPASTHSQDTPLESTSTSYAPSASTQVPTSSTNLDVDRRFSVRSIISLPPYRAAPLPSEQLIAREGERGGVDTVVEFPETEAELEAQREEEMETLFAIRQARRREQAEREERRRARREAREQQDWARLEQIEQESRARARDRAASTASAVSSMTDVPTTSTSTNTSGNRDVGLLIAELASQREARRDRRVSSVSYANLGHARHDGSRIRANSVESDIQPLLDSAASIGSSRHGSRTSSPFASSSRHHRAHSDLSIVSYNSSLIADDNNTPPASRITSNDFRLTPQVSLDTSEDITDTPIPIPSTEPPSYDDDLFTQQNPYDHEEAPPYTSPVLERGVGPRLPSVRVRTRIPPAI